ncbi:MAG: cytochrome P450 [Pseudomonadota bacterium]|nr:cytochrome P450 [Pseudomonadota bacterium]
MDAPLSPDAPMDPIAAVTHPDPYPHYATWRDGPALAWVPPRGVWMATRGDVVRRLLATPALRVRPVTEPVPAALLGRPAGELFGLLIRMNDGPVHDAHRPAIGQALAGLSLPQVRARALALARAQAGRGTLDDALFELPVQAVAQALGFAAAELPRVAAWVREFVACLSPLAGTDDLNRAHRAAESLMARMTRLVADAAPRDASLLQAVQAGGGAQARSARPLIANLVGLLSQTCDATAGLVGNSLLAWARHGAPPPDATPPAWIEEVARHDAAVQNTRRFVAEDTVLEGQPLRAGDVVLLVLAAAQRDPAMNPAPDRFDPERPARQLLGFGHGPHACPGQALATLLAGAAVQALREQGLDREAVARHAGRYRASVNTRIPSWET